MRQKIFIIAAIVLFLTAGAFAGYRSYSANRLLAQANSAFRGGDYDNALENYFAFSRIKGGGAAEEKIARTKEFLVAQENFKKAKQAAEEGDWLETKFLLSDLNPALRADPEFYREALSLSQQAAEKVKALEEKISVEMKALKDEADRVRREREIAKKQTEEIAGRLKKTQKEKENARQEAKTARQEAAAAQKEAAVERMLKFKNELSLLVGLLESGSGLLSEGIAQIESGNGAVALTFLNQARAIFSSVEDHGEDLKLNRTPKIAVFQADMLLDADSFFKKAVLNLGSATVFIEEKNDSFFKYLNDGKAFADSGAKGLNELKAILK